MDGILHTAGNVDTEYEYLITILLLSLFILTCTSFLNLINLEARVLLLVNNELWIDLVVGAAKFTDPDTLFGVHVFLLDLVGRGSLEPGLAGLRLEVSVLFVAEDFALGSKYGCTLLAA